MDNKEHLNLDEAMYRKACIMADTLFHNFYNKNAEEMHTSEELDLKIKKLMVLSYMEGALSCLTKPDDYLLVLERIKDIKK